MENYTQWEKRREEIKAIFRETRKSKRLFPHDINNGYSLDEIKEMVDSELSAMTPIRHSIGKYIKNKLNRKDFEILVEYNPAKAGTNSFMVNAPKDAETAIIYHKALSNFERQVVISEALAFIALTYVRWVREEEQIYNRGDLLYFTQELLILYASMDNGAFLRGTQVIPTHEVINEINNIYPGYNPDATEKIQDIKSLLKNIFPEYPNVRIPALNCEKRIIEKHIKEKHMDATHYPDIENFRMTITPANIGYNKPFGRVSFYHNKDTRQIGGAIQHTPREELADFLSAPEQNAPCYAVGPDNAQNIVRIIVAHEIAHTVLSYEYGSTYSNSQNEESRTPETERDAFYFVWLLLNHREFLYLSNASDTEYIKARKRWKELITYVYQEQPNFDAQYLEWIMEDEVVHS